MSRSRKQPYTKGKAVDKTCRNHGSCPYCQNNRKHKNNRREPADSKEQQNENESWPTLKGRLSQPITTTEEALLQLKETMPLSKLAQDKLKKKKK